MLNITVAIPTFNGADRLPLVLDRLQQQKGLEALSWEVIVVDNNSTDHTRQIVEHYQHHFICPLHYCLEPQQGAGFARKRAIELAQSDLVGFLDDDNLPDENWVFAGYKFAEKYPKAGAIGSQIHGDYEVDPPAGIKQIAFFLAITELGDRPLRYLPQKKRLPPTAGLVVRKQVWLDHVPKHQFLHGPTATLNLNSEDLEAVLHIQNAGWDIWYNPDMIIHHRISAQRLTRQNLLRTIRGTGLARHHIRMLRFQPWQRPVIFCLGFLNDLRLVLLCFVQNFKRLGNDLAVDCKMEFLRSSLISPIYLWMKKNG